jgi:hypothetical protein
MIHFILRLFLPLLVLLVSACSGTPDAADSLRPDVDWDVVAMAADADLQVSWREDVQPVLEKRCVVCHGCFDAPCQLKLGSYEGLMRGANPDKVYNGYRVKVAKPTRLFIDAETEAEWQGLGFHNVVGTPSAESELDPAERMRDSVLYRMLRLKQLNPQPRTGLLPASMTLSLGRKQVCTSSEDMAKFERKQPLWGMPYAMPNLQDSEYRTIISWLAEGAQAPEPTVNSLEAERQIAKWELFLNGTSNRERLVSRYIYEHLFLGHLHFAATPEREFYRLVRSYTPPGIAISEIPAVRPFDDPGVAEFWYRVRRYDSTIVAKSHVVYPFSDEKLTRYQELFFSSDYEVESLPGYVMPETANPFISFAAIPAESRYRFMLDDARFFIQGFIKGPVCRGQVALNVIEDQFWVFFASPWGMEAEDRAEILSTVADYLQMPTATQTFKLTEAYRRFWKGQKKYLAAKNEYVAANYPESEAAALGLIWDGEGTNPNAALTIFRNFDSASVEYGLLGNYPETAWIINYPLFERIHYLLVAGFDVYGNVGHQLNTRLFMDFLRMEGEDSFLAFLPSADRQGIRDKWYQGIREKRQKYFEEPIGWLEMESPVKYQTNDPQRELYDILLNRLGAVAEPVDFLNRCAAIDCESAGKTAAVREADTILRRLATMKGAALKVFPDLLYLRVETEGEEDIPYTLIYNKAYTNLNSFLDDGESKSRDPDQDTLTLLRGFSGTYPNFFFVVPQAELEVFVEQAENLKSVADYHEFVATYGVRRTNVGFWAQSDWFHDRYAEAEPLEWGILDLSRYNNF